MRRNIFSALIMLTKKRSRVKSFFVCGCDRATSPFVKKALGNV